MAPFIDKGKKKSWILGLDILMMSVYLVMGFWISNHDFQYLVYVVLSLTLGTISYRDCSYGTYFSGSSLDFDCETE